MSASHRIVSAALGVAAIVTFQVVQSAPPAQAAAVADLHISRDRGSWSTARTDDGTHTFNVQVRNEGTAASGPFLLQTSCMYRTATGDVDEVAVDLDPEAPSIEAGASTSYAWACTMRDGVEATGGKITVLADERDKTDNSWAMLWATS